MIDQKVKEYCEKHKFSDPVELLVGLTNGVDLRGVNLVFNFVQDFEEQYGEDAELDETEWRALKDLIKSEARFHTVSVAESLKAQKALIEYQHPKKKSIDLQANIPTTNIVTPLTTREIKRFKRKFERTV